MNKEEILNKYINLIDKGYCSDCNELNCIDNFPHSKITHAIRELQQENQELKKQLEEYKRLGFKHLNDKCNKLENQQKVFIEYLESEIDRLARECSQIYEDSLGKTRLVNEDIFNEVDKILSKYKEILGDTYE